MKTITNNKDNLSISEIDITTNKVRALIVDSTNKIIITKYADIYMLPGGKVNKNESYENALIRELKEELGITFENNEITPFIQFENYQKNYPPVDSDKKVNKLNKTIYYIIKTDKKIDNSKIKLTVREKNNDFKILYLELDKAIDTITNHISINKRNPAFKVELINILEEFKNINFENMNNKMSLYELYKKAEQAEINSLHNYYLDKIIKPYTESDKLIDMHAHTNYSDGELSPNELVRLAINKNVGTLAITDHDTLEGIKNIDRNNPLIVDSGIKIINGIELSTKIDKGTMHILGYDFDINSPILNNKMNELKDNSINSVLSIIEQLKKDYNIYFTYDELKELVNYNHNLGRPDIARLLIKKEYVKSVQEAFDKYLIDANNKIGNRKKGLHYSECIDLISKSGGIPVLAHPKSLELSDKELLYLLKDMINYGLMGIEVYHPTHTLEETSKYFKLANKLDLLISGGSDYHGINTKPDIELGTGKNNNIKIKDLNILDKIKIH